MTDPVKPRILVLGAGFGGLELATVLSDAAGDRLDITLIDRNDSFAFGYSKLDVMFGRTRNEATRFPYSAVEKPGVTLLQESISEIDANARTVTTDAGTHEADVIVIALGADYDLGATPGLAEFGNEFYSFEGAADLAPVIESFGGGDVVIGVADAPFKCPPAPSECALLIHDSLVAKGVRDESSISFVLPLGAPVPPSPETSAELISVFDERGISFIPGRRISSLTEGEVTLDDGASLPFDLLLGVPKHRAPQIVLDTGLTEDGYVPVDSNTLKTKVEGVYAVGDVATAGVPKAGVFAEGAARIVAQSILAEFCGGPPPERHLGQGTCYIEFGEGRIGSVDIDFLSGPERTGTYHAPSEELMAHKKAFGATRRGRWFGTHA